MGEILSPGWKIEPIGGGTYPYRVPPGEPATEFGWPENPVMVRLKQYKDVDGNNRWEFSEDNSHGGPCDGSMGQRPETDDRAKLTLPAPGSQLSATTLTFYWSAYTGAVEYFLEITDENSANIFASSAGQNTSIQVTGLPDDGRELIVLVWTKFAEQPHWKRNEYRLDAYNAP